MDRCGDSRLYPQPGRCGQARRQDGLSRRGAAGCGQGAGRHPILRGLFGREDL